VHDALAYGIWIGKPTFICRQATHALTVICFGVPPDVEGALFVSAGSSTVAGDSRAGLSGVDMAGSVGIAFHLTVTRGLGTK
jgi:hypothetical protein